jgi:TP901-1 family phage major tail protein
MEPRWFILRIKQDDQFVTVGRLRTKATAFNAQVVDVTHAESAGRWRALLDGAGVKRATVSGAGEFSNPRTDRIVRQAFFDGEVCECQVSIDDFGTVEGPFQVSSLEYTGTTPNGIAFDITLESCGELTFKAWA